MPSIAPLNQQQIADLYGALDDFVGTGDNINAIFNATFFPVVIEKILDDDLIGLGDGAATAYNTNFFCDAPRTIQNLKLFKTTVTVPANQLTIVTHYTVNTTTGAITLTPAGVTFLGLEQLHATYTIPSTVELHIGTIVGTLLTTPAEYSINERTGKITLTAAGVASLGLAQLHAKYYTAKGTINLIDDDSAGIGASRVQVRIRKREVTPKDQDLGFVHESIETEAIVDVTGTIGLEPERRYLSGQYVTPAEQITEALLIQNVTYAYRSTPFTGFPLFPPGIFPPPANPSIPNLTAAGLSGGTGVDVSSESNQISIEVAQYASIILSGLDIAGPLGWDLRFLSSFTGTMLTAIAAQQVALTNQITAITGFLANNPVPNDHVTALDISDATAASAAASAQFAANAAYVLTVTTPPHSGLSNAQIDNIPPGVRYLAQFARQAAIVTRNGQISVALSGVDRLYDRRRFWITERARLGDGTLAILDQCTKGDDRAATLLAQNASRRTGILLIISAQ